MGPRRPSWVATALRVGVLYVVAGVVFAAMAGASGSNAGRVVWRLAAWLVSAVLFAAHIRYEHFALRNPPRLSALHVAAAVAIGGFGLAVAASVRSLGAASADRHPRLYALALVAWPAVTAVPAYLVAFAATAVLSRLPTEDQGSRY